MKNAGITEQEAQAYLKDKGVNCPVCGSADISGDGFEVDEGGAYQDMRCEDCGTQWIDIYSLDGIEDDVGNYFYKPREGEGARKTALTKEDWAEIYYALEYKRLFHPEVLTDKGWMYHLDQIILKIGPDGCNMIDEGVAP